MRDRQTAQWHSRPSDCAAFSFCKRSRIERRHRLFIQPLLGYDGMLEITREMVGTIPVWRLHGGLVFGAAIDTLRAALGELLDSHQRFVVLNLEDVAQIDSSAIGVLLAVQERLSTAGGRLLLAHGSERFRAVLATMNLEGVLAVAGDERDAIRRVAEPAPPSGDPLSTVP